MFKVIRAVIAHAMVGIVLLTSTPLQAMPRVLVQETFFIVGTVDNSMATNGWSADSFIQWIDSLDENTVAVLVIESPGGYVDDGERMIAAIHRSKAIVVAVVPRFAASMAADIASECSRLVVRQNAALVFHASYVYILGAKYHPWARDQHVKQIQRYQNIFSPVELHSMFTLFKDFVVPGYEYKQRLEENGRLLKQHPNGVEVYK